MPVGILLFGEKDDIEQIGLPQQLSGRVAENVPDD